MSLYQIAMKQREAYAVMHGIAIERQFSDAELAESAEQIRRAHIEMYGTDPLDDSGKQLSTQEESLLKELTHKMRPFSVTVTIHDRVEQIGVMAPTSCDAAVQIIQLLFRDADECCATTGFKVKVEAINEAPREEDRRLLQAA